MKISILTPNPFPIGNVATNRLSTYANSLANVGYFVKIYILKSTEPKYNVKNYNVRGIHNNVQYEYMSSSTIWNTEAPKIVKLYLYIKGIWLTSKKLRRDKINIIIMYTNDAFYIGFFGMYCKLYGLKYYIDKSEYPSVLSNRNLIYKFLYIKLFKLFDGIIVMTNELKAYYELIISNSAECFLLPMSVDSQRFVNIIKDEFSEPFFASLFGVHNRDNILDTLRAFAEFKGLSTSNVKLYLIGDFENLINKEEISDFLIHNPHIKNEVYFTGILSSELIPKLLINATGLITTPLKYSSGGFPTKLGEYLATGNPVVATCAGEIGLFLKNKENSLLSEPGDIVNIAENIEWIVQNKILAQEIGRKGQALAFTKFNVDTYRSNFINFLTNN